MNKTEKSSSYILKNFRLINIIKKIGIFVSISSLFLSVFVVLFSYFGVHDITWLTNTGYVYAIIFALFAFSFQFINNFIYERQLEYGALWLKLLLIIFSLFIISYGTITLIQSLNSTNLVDPVWLSFLIFFLLIPLFFSLPIIVLIIHPKKIYLENNEDFELSNLEFYS